MAQEVFLNLFVCYWRVLSSLFITKEKLGQIHLNFGLNLQKNVVEYLFYQLSKYSFKYL